MPSKDETNPDALQWDEANRVESLERLHGGAVNKAQETVNWYKKNRKWKRRFAQGLRLAALSLLGIGGTLPVLIDISGQGGIFAGIPPSIATLIIAAGTGLIALDRFMGYSTGWMRYITNEMLITSRLQSFQYEWEAERINWEGKTPSLEQTRMMVNRCANLTDEIAAIVRDETQAWAEEFQSNLKLLDDKFKSLTISNHVGAISLTVENGDQYVGGWDLLIDNHINNHFHGSTAGVNNVLPGFRNITVIGRDGNNREICSLSNMVTVEPGKLASTTIRLPVWMPDKAPLPIKIEIQAEPSAVQPHALPADVPHDTSTKH